MIPIERVARAMLAEAVRQSGEAGDFVGDDEQWPEVCLDGSFDIEALARAAIEAFRIPDGHMTTAGEKCGDDAPVTDIWCRMIDAALEEEGDGGKDLG